MVCAPLSHISCTNCFRARGVGKEASAKEESAMVSGLCCSEGTLSDLNVFFQEILRSTRFKSICVVQKL